VTDELIRRLSDLSAQEKRKLLQKLLSEKIESSSLSHGQRALWFLYRLAPESTAYNLLYTARLRFAVDLPVLQHSVQALVQRYPLLTATYTMVGKEPVQHLNKGQSIQVEAEDASLWSVTALEQQLDKEGNSPFDLEQGPLLRIKLYLRTAQDAILSLTIHHIIADLSSLSVIVDELIKLYAANGDVARAQLPPASMPYADYVRWQKEMLSGPEGEGHWHYWKQKLTGELPELKLPTDRPRPAVQTYKGASFGFKLSSELSNRLRQREIGRAHV